VKLTRGRLVFGLLLVALVAVTIWSARPPIADLPQLSVRSTQPHGARALWLWLEALGYQVQEIDADPYQVDQSVAVLFILQPTTRFDAAAVDAVASWVDAGGRLVVASDGAPRRLLERFGLTIDFAGARQTDARPVQPLLTHPPLERIKVDSWEQIEAVDGLAPWLAADQRVLLGSHPYGGGTVLVLAATYPLTNAALAAPEHAALVLNLLAGVPAGAPVAFDEYHHGFVRGASQNLWSLLLAHPWGWAALYALLLAYLYLWLGGRRFGPPLLEQAAPRRSVSEYVASIATLYRRARQRGYAADRLADQLKRSLADGLGLSPALPDPDFAATVAARRGSDAAPLARLLARLRQGEGLQERDLLALVREADALQARLLRQSPGLQPRVQAPPRWPHGG
jgi:hypothetical protein